MHATDPVLFAYDDSGKMLFVSRVEPPFKMEEVVGQFAWYCLHGQTRLEFQAAFQRAYSEGVPQMVDSDVPPIGVWRTTIYPCRLGKVRALGFSFKIPDAVRQLTDREREIVKLLAQGLGSKKAAAMLGIARSTFDNHRQNISRKLGIASRALDSWAGHHLWWL